MSQPPSHNRRTINLRMHPRIFTPSGALFSFNRLVIQAQFGEHAEGEGALIDLSLGGCRLLSEIPLEVSARYNLILQISRESSPIVVEAAVVRWSQGNTYGLKFTSIQSIEESHLRELLLDIRPLAP